MDSADAKLPLPTREARTVTGGKCNVPASPFAPAVGFHDLTAGLFGLSADSFVVTAKAFRTAESLCFLDFTAFLKFSGRFDAFSNDSFAPFF